MNHVAKEILEVGDVSFSGSATYEFETLMENVV